VIVLARLLLDVNIIINGDKLYWSVKMLIFQYTAVNQTIWKQQSGMAYSQGMWRRSYLKYLLLLLLGAYTAVYAQEDKTKAHLRAEQLEGVMIDGESCKKLIGNVVIALGQVTIHADQAIYYDKSRLMWSTSQMLRPFIQTISIMTCRPSKDALCRGANL
jgi:hypothetical protein